MFRRGGAYLAEIVRLHEVLDFPVEGTRYFASDECSVEDAAGCYRLVVGANH